MNQIACFERQKKKKKKEGNELKIRIRSINHECCGKGYNDSCPSIYKYCRH